MYKKQNYKKITEPSVHNISYVIIADIILFHSLSWLIIADTVSGLNLSYVIIADTVIVTVFFA